MSRKDFFNDFGKKDYATLENIIKYQFKTSTDDMKTKEINDIINKFGYKNASNGSSQMPYFYLDENNKLNLAIDDGVDFQPTLEMQKGHRKLVSDKYYDKEENIQNALDLLKQNNMSADYNNMEEVMFDWKTVLENFDKDYNANPNFYKSNNKNTTQNNTNPKEQPKEQRHQDKSLNKDYQSYQDAINDLNERYDMLEEDYNNNKISEEEYIEQLNKFQNEYNEVEKHNPNKKDYKNIIDDLDKRYEALEQAYNNNQISEEEYINQLNKFQNEYDEAEKSNPNRKTREESKEEPPPKKEEPPIDPYKDIRENQRKRNEEYFNNQNTKTEEPIITKEEKILNERNTRQKEYEERYKKNENEKWYTDDSFIGKKINKRRERKREQRREAGRKKSLENREKGQEYFRQRDEAYDINKRLDEANENVRKWINNKDGIRDIEDINDLVTERKKARIEAGLEQETPMRELTSLEKKIEGFKNGSLKYSDLVGDEDFANVYEDIVWNDDLLNKWNSQKQEYFDVRKENLDLFGTSDYDMEKVFNYREEKLKRKYTKDKENLKNVNRDLRKAKRKQHFSREKDKEDINKKIEQLTNKKQKMVENLKKSKREYKNRYNENYYENNLNDLRKELNTWDKIDSVREAEKQLKSGDITQEAFEDIKYSLFGDKELPKMNRSREEVEKEILKNKKLFNFASNKTEKELEEDIVDKLGSKIKNAGKINVAFAGINAVAQYKDSRQQGRGVVSSVARAGIDFALSEALGPWTYAGLTIAKELPSALIKGTEFLNTQVRNMNTSSRFTVFGEAQFQDSEQLATMRQSGMELAKMSQYRLEQTLMGNEAKYLHK